MFSDLYLGHSSHPYSRHRLCPVVVLHASYSIPLSSQPVGRRCRGYRGLLLLWFEKVRLQTRHRLFDSCVQPSFIDPLSPVRGCRGKNLDPYLLFKAVLLNMQDLDSTLPTSPASA